MVDKKGFENDEGQVVTVPLAAYENASARYCRAIGLLVGFAVIEAAAFGVAVMKMGGVL